MLPSALQNVPLFLYNLFQVTLQSIRHSGRVKSHQEALRAGRIGNPELDIKVVDECRHQEASTICEGVVWPLA